MLEEWRPIEGFEGLYEVSSEGRVRSLDRGKRKGRLMKPRKLKGTGHWDVGLCKNGISVRRYVHRLVLRAFIGPCPEGMESLHRDGNAGNNRLKNLRWGTRKENVEDQYRLGERDGHPTPPKHPRSDLIASLAPDIFRASGTLRQVASSFGVSVSTVQKIRKTFFA